MTEYIKREDAIKAIESLPDCYNGFSDTYDKACIIGVLQEIPTVDVMKRKTGKWVLKTFNDGYGDYQLYECNQCEEYDDTSTISDVYISMTEERKYVLKRLLKYAANRTFPNSSEADYLNDVFSTFTENEKLATYYLANEAVLEGNEVFKKLELWVLLKGD